MPVVCCSVWSVAHSALQPNLTASGADDGIVRLWHDRALRGGSTALVPAGGAAVCGVEFCDEDSNLLAVACADSCSYVYDLRNRCGYSGFDGLPLIDQCCSGHIVCVDLSSRPQA